MYIWTNDEIEKILLQLDEQKLPFKKFSFVRQEGHLQLLGRGGFALVYGAQSRSSCRDEYAIKVVGFGQKHIDSSVFHDINNAQGRLSSTCLNVLQEYNAIELFVWVNDDADVEKVKVITDGEESYETNCIKLQFIVMEKLEPIIVTNQQGKSRIGLLKLVDYREEEIIKLAYDVGNALARAHKKGILHRDVKLENIFYSPKQEIYKLGDFGIAKVTDEGMASTIAFTKGYGAPEVVGNLTDKYDNTADIYSFGMLLYVLLNKQCFPESNNYSVNFRAQYKPGYVLPTPQTGSDELIAVVKKMCMYEPDDRYQSMDDVVSDLRKIMYGRNIHYKYKHNNATFMMGAIFLLMGFFLLNATSTSDYRWLTITSFALAVVLLLQTIIIKYGSRWQIRIYFRNNIYWGIVSSYFLMSIILGLLLEGNTDVYVRTFGIQFVQILQGIQLIKVGIAGIIFCIVWMLRERILSE